MTYAQLYEALTRQLCLEDIALYFDAMEVELPTEEADILRNVFKDAKVVHRAESVILHFQEISNSATSVPASSIENRMHRAANLPAPSAGYMAPTQQKQNSNDAARYTSAVLQPPAVVTTETASAQPRPKRKVEKPSASASSAYGGGISSGDPASREESQSEHTEESSQSSRAGLADSSAKKSADAGWFGGIWR
jgi:hypothetical protein